MNKEIENMPEKYVLETFKVYKNLNVILEGESVVVGILALCQCLAGIIPQQDDMKIDQVCDIIKEMIGAIKELHEEIEGE